MSLNAKFQKLFPLMHLFLSNDSPSDAELLQLATFVHEIEAALGPFAAQLNLEQDQLLLFDPLQSLVRSLKGPMSPIRRLPVEIMAEIFLDCLPIHNERRWNDLHSDREPWTLVGVCKKWRKIALGEQRLWAAVEINGYHTGFIDQPNGPTLAKIVACLARSGTHSLAVYSWSDGDSSFLYPFIPYSDRLEFLGFCLDRDSLGFLERIKGRLPELCELDIHDSHNLCFKPWLHINELPVPFVYLEDAPKLQKLTILSKNPQPLWKDPTFKLPWHQLTRLATNHVDLLSYCPRLVTCALDHTYGPYGFEGPNQTMHSNIRELSLGSTKMLKSLVLPSLESLFIGDCSITCSTQDNVCDVRSLLSRSRCTLTTLRIYWTKVEDGLEVEKLINDCPSLLTVVFRDGDIHLDHRAGWKLGREYGDLLVYSRTPDISV